MSDHTPMGLFLDTVQWSRTDHCVDGGDQGGSVLPSRLFSDPVVIRAAADDAIPVVVEGLTCPAAYDRHTWAIAGVPEQEELERSAMSAMVASLVIVGSGGLALLGGVAWATVRIVRLMWGG